MAYFEPYIDQEGIHIPTYDDIMEYLTGRYKAIFGDDSYLGMETPDYQLLSVFAKCLDDYAALAVDAYNARNPGFAQGDALDVLVSLVGITRLSATHSKAVLRLSGVEGTQIDAGKKAVDTSGYLWTLQSTSTIPAAGYVDVNAVCDTAGEIVAPIGSINGIYNPEVGWESVTNQAEAETGRNVETDAELRNRFAYSHAVTASGISGSLTRGLLALDGVKFAVLAENNTGSTDDRGIPAHSFSAVVDGGEDEDIAKTIFNLKAPGVGTYGSESETITDETGATTTIYFARPSESTITVNIGLTALTTYDADRVDAKIQDAIISDISSLGIGHEWPVTMAYKDIYSAFAGEDIPFVITSLTAKKGSGQATTGTIECAYNEVFKTGVDNVIIALDP